MQIAYSDEEDRKLEDPKYRRGSCRKRRLLANGSLYGNGD